MIETKDRTINLSILILILITFLYPPAGVVLFIIGILEAKKNGYNYFSPNYAFLIAFLIAAYGYNLYTDATDLHTYIERIQDINGWSLSMIFNNLFFNSNTKLYVTDFLFYIASKSGNPYLLPWMIGLIDYSIIFYMFFDYRNRCKNSNLFQLLLIVIMLLGISTPMAVISNTRCVTSYIIISFATYRDLVQGEKNLLTVFLYILPIWIHTSAIIFLMIRLLVYLVKYIGIFSIVIAFLTSDIINWLHSILYTISTKNVIISLFSNAIDQAYQYLQGKNSEIAIQYANDSTNNFVRSYGTFFILLLLFIIYFQSFIHKENKLRNERIVEYLIMVSVIALGSLNIPTGIFWRYESAVIFLAPIVLMRTLNDTNIYVRYLSYILLLSGLFAALYMFRIQRSWVPLSVILNGLLKTNGIDILVRFLNVLV